MSAVLKSCCAEHGIALNAAHLSAIEATAGTHPILQAIWAYIQGLIAKTALIPYAPQIVADMAAGNWVGALVLIYSVLAGTAPAPNPAA